MTAFISAGHDLKNVGVQANNFQEEKVMITFRNKVVSKYKQTYPQSKVICDTDYEKLGDYLKRIETADGSVVVEFHLDFFSDSKVSGISAWVGDDADKLDKQFAAELCTVGSNTLGIPNRSVHPESESFHKKLGLMREKGIVCLVEICPISNKQDMDKFIQHMDALAFEFVTIIIKHEHLNK